MDATPRPEDLDAQEFSTPQLGSESEGFAPPCGG